MKTTVDIPDKVLRDAMNYTHAKTKREAILTAMAELNQRHAQAELVKYFGRFDSLMTNDEIERSESGDERQWTRQPRTHGNGR